MSICTPFGDICFLLRLLLLIPASDKFTITLPDKTSIWDIHLYDGKGKLVHQTQLWGDDNTVKIDKLESGVYIIKMNNGDEHFVENITVD